MLYIYETNKNHFHLKEPVNMNDNTKSAKCAVGHSKE